MSDDLAHLDAAHRAQAGLSADERIEWIRQDRWIHYARADHVLARLTDLLTYPPRDRMPCVLLFGATGMGKTRIVHKFLREHRSSFDKRSGRTCASNRFDFSGRANSALLRGRRCEAFFATDDHLSCVR